MTRAVICCGKCGLNQFVTLDGLCRRCRRGLLRTIAPLESPAPEFSPLDLGRRIVRLREYMQISQTKLALLAGVSRARLCKVENNKKPGSISFAEKIAKGFGMSIRGLLSADPIDDPWVIDVMQAIRRLNEDQRAIILKVIRLQWRTTE